MTKSCSEREGGNCVDERITRRGVAPFPEKLKYTESQYLEFNRKWNKKYWDMYDKWKNRGYEIKELKQKLKRFVRGKK